MLTAKEKQKALSLYVKYKQLNSFGVIHIHEALYLDIEYAKKLLCPKYESLFVLTQVANSEYDNHSRLVKEKFENSVFMGNYASFLADTKDLLEDPILVFSNNIEKPIEYFRSLYDFYIVQLDKEEVEFIPAEDF